MTQETGLQFEQQEDSQIKVLLDCLPENEREKYRGVIEKLKITSPKKSDEEESAIKNMDAKALDYRRMDKDKLLSEANAEAVRRARDEAFTEAEEIANGLVEFLVIPNETSEIKRHYRRKEYYEIAEEIRSRIGKEGV